MIDNHSKFNIITDEIDDKFIVYITDKKTFIEKFKYEFTVYRNFDKKGLIEDAIDIYKRKLNIGRNTKQ